MRARASQVPSYVLRRVAHAVPLAIAIVVVTFVLIHLAPGDPLLLLAGDGGTPAYYADMRARYGLDLPLSEQFVHYCARLLRGDFGYSFSYQRPAGAVVLERLPATLLMGGAALVLGVFAGLVFGAISAARPGSWLDAAVRTSAAAAYALPVFWLAQLLILAFALWLPLFPVGGMTSARLPGGEAGSPADVLWHLVLPATALAISFAPVLARVTRAALIDALGQPWAIAVRARGVSRERLLIRHALPNAIVPLLMVVGHQAGALLSGAALTEVVFAWPGLGRLLLDASLTRDAPLAIVILLTGVATVVAANLAADVASLLTDPRVKP